MKNRKYLVLGLVCIMSWVLVTGMPGCQGANPKTEGEIKSPEDVGRDDNSKKVIRTENKSQQRNNNPWAWLLAVVVNNLMWLLFISYCSAWKGRRGL